MKIKHQMVYLMLICIISSIYLVPIISGADNSQNIARNQDSLSYNLRYNIFDSNGEVYFYPVGIVSTEVGGSIRLDFTGYYSEWNEVQPFF
ncbi:MAG: hypothetical protein ACTSWC_03250, partial [Promethearchaeota archaeon]